MLEKLQIILTWRKFPLNLDRAFLYGIRSLAIDYVTECVSHEMVVSQVPLVPSTHGTHLTKQLWNWHYLELVGLEDHSREERFLLSLRHKTHPRLSHEYPGLNVILQVQEGCSLFSDMDIAVYSAKSAKLPWRQLWRSGRCGRQFPWHPNTTAP